MSARMIPDRPPTEPASERATYLALSRLPDGWTVIHSVAWQAPRRHRQHDGEADFVLIHPRVGLIVLEVKGGGVRCEGGRWYRLAAGGTAEPIDDPFAQARESKHALLQFLRERDAFSGFLPMGHGVVFPDLGTAPLLGPGEPPGIVLVGPDLADPEAALRRIADAFDMGSAEAIDTAPIIDALAPTMVARRLLADDVAEAAARLIRLTDEQISLLRGLRRNRRALILGGAGTGKTVLAREKAVQLAADGARVLLTCFNRPLADHLSAGLVGVPGVIVSTFHSFCRTQILGAGLEFPEHPDQAWWDSEAATQLAVALEATGERVDAIVLDEGQDFAPDWFEALHLALQDPEEAAFYVFADRHQAIYRPDWVPPFRETVFELERNCRNTLPIAEKVAAVFGGDTPTEGVPGLTPEFHEVQSREGAVALLPGILHGLLNLGRLQPRQVVILAQAKDLVVELRGRTVAGSVLCEPGGQGVAVETIHRFKGLEADAVIVILDRVEHDRHRSLAYIGISRARTHLTLIGPAGVADAISWST